MSGYGGRLLDWIDMWIVDRPGTVVIVFLLITAGFATGLDDITMSSGTEQIAQDVPAYDTYQRMEDDFTFTFGQGTDTTQLIQTNENVLSREGLLRMLETQQRLSDREDFRVADSTSVANLVARELDPSATTLDAQIRAVEQASDAERRAAVRRASRHPSFGLAISDDFNQREAYASSTLAVVEHDVYVESSDVGSGGEATQLTDIQLEARRVTDSVGGDVRVFGSGIISYENSKILEDSLRATIPAVVVLLLLFLAIAYRDPFDLALGVLALSMALIWTFGFMGLANIPFTQLLVSLPPLLLAIGVDFGVHTINRYREELADGVADRRSAMDGAMRHLLVAFFLVTGTSVIGFSANMTSGLGMIRDFGLVAAVGITFDALVFGVFLPAAKLLVERARAGTRLPAFNSKPLGSEDSMLGRLMPLHLTVTSQAPKLFLVAVLLLAAVSGYHGSGVDSSFEDEDFLPPEELPAYLYSLPEPMQPGEYTTTRDVNFIEDHFETSNRDTVTVYVEGPMYRDDALESIARAGDDPPDSFVTDETNHARSESILTVIRTYARESPEFARLVAANDANGNGIPDDNLRDVYDALLASPYEDRAESYLTADYHNTRVVYSVEADATRADTTVDAAEMADRYRFEAVETGGTVVFQRVADTIFATAVTSLGTALILAGLFLLFIYYLLVGDPRLAPVTMLPIIVTATLLVGTMRVIGVPFNTLTATILSITVGIGIDYAVHVVHRFVDEVDASGDPHGAAIITLRGTGGALAGSMLTTLSGAGALYFLSITPLLKQFGLLLSISVTYAFLNSVIVLPIALLLWARRSGRGQPSAVDGREGTPA
ncbi:RND family transporter [Halopenitus sp. H-Gu1]|uniref:efflux RND transporter permease subunit n=1 Tax=Halopenitus sp. H-Gu1 TaxID=3242697 RepID=UPI00359EA67D